MGKSEFKEIKLTQGKFAIVDAEDFGFLNKLSWHYNNLGYASCSSGFLANVQMHRIILNPAKRQEVDHINEDKLDNSRANLRVCTPSNNKMNRGKLSTNTTGYKGVTWSGSKKNPYQAQIAVGYKRYYLGIYPTPELAFGAYKEAAVRLHGEFAKW